MIHAQADGFIPALPANADWILRLVERRDEAITVRKDVLQPVQRRQNIGACISVRVGEGTGYAATADISPAGLQEAVRRAQRWAETAARFNLVPAGSQPWPEARVHYATPTSNAVFSLRDVIDLLHTANRHLHSHAQVVHWEAGIARRESQVVLTSSRGAEIVQTIQYLSPALMVVASDGHAAEQRSFGGDYVRQGGLEQLAAIGFEAAAAGLTEECLALLTAPRCPDGSRDLLLMPGQMVLQIHESIGHPLELDRILGDERNYAGGSFVTPDMFGHYQYGSPLLNVTYDPSRPEQIASYACDDDGTPAERQFLIRYGVLQRPLGGACSQARSGLPGVACSRADNWNRPPIDRMANLNLEPGHTAFDDLVKGIERGVLMDTNRSWSIDDLRNSFQFGCEYARLIEDGELKGVVKQAGYRGVSAAFWRNLSAVGDVASMRVMGLATCGKGEPNQIMQVGHASPPCVFKDVDVFGSG